MKAMWQTFSMGIIEISKQDLGLVVLSAAIGTVLGLIYAATRPVVYVSEIEIELPTQTLDASSSGAEVLLKVRQRMTSADLYRIASECNVYPDWRSNKAVEEVASRMRQDILIKSPKVNFFRVGFRAADADLAQRVAGQIASLYEPSSRKVSEEVLAKLKQAETELSKQEEKLRDFNTRFLGSQVQKQTQDLVALNRLILRLRSNIDLLGGLERERASQVRLLAETNRPHRESDSQIELIGQSKATTSTREKLEARAPGTKLQLQQLPESSDKQTPLDSLGAEGSGSALSQREIKEQLDRLSKQIERSSQEHDRIRKEMSFYQTRINSAPQIKQMHNAVLNGYETAKQNYQSLLTKKTEVELSARQTDNQFIVVKPASFPEERLGWGTAGLAFLGCFLGACVGLGLSVLRNTETQAYLNEEELIHQTGLPVLASISRIVPEDLSVDLTANER
jgi:uncharacterized protein involved in exopolysaccharide biosynthesis